MDVHVLNAAFHAQYPYATHVLEELSVGESLIIADHEFELVAHDAGELVFKLNFDPLNDAQYFRLGYYYSSYDGYEYDDNFVEVKPAEMRVTKWLAI